MIAIYFNPLYKIVSFSTQTMKVKVTQSCLTLCDPMDYTVHGILQARILEWVAFPFSSRSSQPRNQTGVSCIAGWFFTSWAIREAHTNHTSLQFYVKTKMNMWQFYFQIFKEPPHTSQQSHFWAYTPKKPNLKETQVPQCSSQHCLS